MVFMVDLPLTFHCNSNCVSCIHPMSEREDGSFGSQGKDEIELEQIKKFVDQLDDVETISICGGEPTISDNLFPALKYIRDQMDDVLIFLVSNGRMFYYKSFINDLKSIENLEPFRIAIPFYSHRPEVHDSITRVDGSFKQTYQGIKNLLNDGFELELRYIIQQKNFKSLPQFAQFVLSEFPEVFRVGLVNIKYTGNALLNKDDTFVSLSDVVPQAEKAVDKLEEGDSRIKLYHFPLCLLSEKYRSYAEGVTKNEELGFAQVCEDCKEREKCPKIWKSYLELKGEGEFNPIK